MENKHQQQPKNWKEGSSKRAKPDVSNLVFGKVPPQSPDLEEAVLGAMMLEQDAVDKVMGIISDSECFYVDANRRIYETLTRMYRMGNQIDLLTVTAELRRSEDLEIVGGAYYITKLTGSVITGAHVETHAKLIMEKWMARELIRISGTVISMAYEDSTDAFSLLGFAEENFFHINQQTVKKDPVHVGRAALEVTREVLEKRESKIEFSGVPTGLPSLDSCTGGWQPGHLIILAARPAVGKTALALNLAMNAATDPHKPTGVAFFSLEMSNRELIERLQSAISKVPLTNIKHPMRMSDQDVGSYMATQEKLRAMNIHVDDSGGLTAMELRAKVRRLISKYDIGMVMVDYLQLMTGEKGSGNREQEISKLSRNLKMMAKELEIPIIALSQLNRDADRSGKPKLSDLRESGAIEQDADVVMMLYRPSDEDLKAKPNLNGWANLDIKKNRHGSTEDLAFFFDKPVQKWYEQDPAKDVPFGQVPQAEQPVNHYKSFAHIQAQAPQPYKADDVQPTSMFPNKPESIDDLPF